MKNKMKVNKLVRVVIFIGILLIMVQAITLLLKPKWYGQELGHEAVTSMVDGFYNETKNSIDVLFLGSSNVFRDINPTVIYNESGITSYVLGSASQRMWISKYYLKEALKYQTPKVVVLDLYTIFIGDLNGESENRKALDYHKFSFEKLSAIKDSIYYDGETKENYISYLFPVLRYHSRWQELSSEDFRYFFTDKHYYLKGYDIVNSIEQQENYDFFTTETHEPEVSERVLSCLDEMVDICTQNNIEIKFVKFPNVHWTQGMSKVCQDLANSYNVEFIEYNENLNTIGLDFSTDFMDFVHLNYSGAEKLSKFVANQMVEQWNMKPTILSQSDQTRWQEDMIEYERMKNSYHLVGTTDVEKYANMILNNDGYDVYIVTKGSFVMENNKLLELLELDNYQIAHSGETYLGVIKNGQCIVSEIKEGTNEYYSSENRTVLQGQSYEAGDCASIKIDGKEYAKNYGGYNIVIYDNQLSKVVDSIFFNDGMETIGR